VSTSTTPLSVQIFSDVQCPWCYIGKRKFEAAVADFEAQDVPVRWSSGDAALLADLPVTDN